MTIVAEKINSQHDNLIEVIEAEIGGIKQQVVDARNLHTYLESKQDFSTWAKNRLTKYKFVENEDFVRFHKKMEANNATLIEYHLTLDTAKELSMVENNDKGRAARRYFIRCEKMAYEAMKSQFLLEPQTLVKKTTKDKRTALHEAIALLMTKSKYLHFKDCYKMIHQRFNVEHLDEIPEKKLPEAVKYVHSLICGGQQSMFDDNYELIRELTEAVLSQNFMMENVWKALMLINQKDMMYYSKYVLDSNVLARKVSIELGFKTKRGLPLVSEDLNTINFASGVRFTGVNPKWFNAPAW